MKTISLIFAIHLPFRYRKYRFFDIGNNSHYYDDNADKTIVTNMAENCYLPFNNILLKLLKKYKGRFKVAFSISGTALEMFNLYAPDVIDSFKKLSSTGSVEFLAETYSHSLVSLADSLLFEKQVKLHGGLIEKYFNQKPKVFRNPGLIYSDDIGNHIYDMGCNAIFAESTKQVLGLKNPGLLYYNDINPKVKVLIHNRIISKYIETCCSKKLTPEHPNDAEQLVKQIKALPENEKLVNLILNYGTFDKCIHPEKAISGLWEDFIHLALKSETIQFSTPSEITENVKAVSSVHVAKAVSGESTEHDLAPFLGNEMQQEAFTKLYDLKYKVLLCTDVELLKDWNYLQISDHYNSMSTDNTSGSKLPHNFSTYDSPYEAFIVYMNVLSDFSLRLDNILTQTIKKQTNLTKKRC